MSRFPFLLLLPILLIPPALLQAGQIGTLQEKPAALDGSSEIKGGGTPDIVLTMTVGTDSAVCATEKEISVPYGAKVYNCYSIRNDSALTFDLHSLEDELLGSILTNLPYQLAPAASAFITAEFVATADVIGLATWTVTDNDTATVAQSVDSTTVTVMAPLVLTKTVGTDSGVCAVGDEVFVAPGTNVYYCFEIQNNSLVTFDMHELVDSELGTILNNFPYALSAGASGFVTAEYTAAVDVINTATWTGLQEGTGVPFQAIDTASVRVIEPTPTETFTPTPTSTEEPTATPTPTMLVTADLFVLKTDFPDPVQVGQVLTYSLSVGNLGPDEAADLELEDRLPVGVQFLSASPGAMHAAGVVTREWSSIPNGETRSATIAVRVLSTVNLCNLARVRSSDWDPNPWNNTIQACTLGTAPSPHPADVNEDGRVNELDLLEILLHWKLEFM